MWRSSKATVRSLGIHCDIRARAKCLLLSMAVLWPSGAIGRDTSLTCIYDLMTGVRESMVVCGEALDPKSEETYHNLRAALKTFINENTKVEDRKIAPDYDQIKSLRAREAVAKGLCNEPLYSGWKEVLQGFLREEATIRKRLEVPGNPADGDCL